MKKAAKKKSKRPIIKTERIHMKCSPSELAVIKANAEADITAKGNISKWLIMCGTKLLPIKK